MSIPQCSAHRYLIASAGLLVIFAVSIALAVYFPYEDLNAVVNVGVDSPGGGVGDGGIEAEGVDFEGPSSISAEGYEDDAVPSYPVPEAIPDGAIEDSVGAAIEAAAEAEAAANEDSAAETAADTEAVVVLEAVRPSISIAKAMEAAEGRASAGEEEGAGEAEEEEGRGEEKEEDPHHGTVHAVKVIGRDDGASAFAEDDGRAVCRSMLARADADGDGLLVPSEYASLINELRPPAEPRRPYPDLPYELKMNFVHLSCVCPVRKTCCADASGIYVGEGAGERLDRVCSRTRGALADTEA